MTSNSRCSQPQAAVCTLCVMTAHQFVSALRQLVQSLCCTMLQVPVLMRTSRNAHGDTCLVYHPQEEGHHDASLLRESSSTTRSYALQSSAAAANCAIVLTAAAMLH